MGCPNTTVPKIYFWMPPWIHGPFFNSILTAFFTATPQKMQEQIFPQKFLPFYLCIVTSDLICLIKAQTFSLKEMRLKLIGAAVG